MFPQGTCAGKIPFAIVPFRENENKPAPGPACLQNYKNNISSDIAKAKASAILNRIFYTCFAPSVRQDTRNSTKPTANSSASIPMPTLALPVSWLPTLTIMVPRKDAPLPQMSNRPKYSPDFSAGMILAKWLRLSACTPPWNMPTSTASIQNCHWLVRKKANTAMPV